MNKVYISLPVSADKFNPLMDTLRSLKAQTYKNFTVEIHISENDLRSVKYRLRNMVDSDQRFKFIPIKMDLGSYKKYLSVKYHDNDYIFLASCGANYPSNFIERGLTIINSNKKLVYSSSISAMRLSDEGVKTYSNVSLNQIGYYGLKGDIIFHSSIFNGVWFDLNWIYNTGCKDDLTFLHFILTSHGIKNKKLEFQSRLGLEAKANVRNAIELDWKLFWNKLKVDKPNLIHLYSKNSINFYESKKFVPSSKFSDHLDWMYRF